MPSIRQQAARLATAALALPLFAAGAQPAAAHSMSPSVVSSVHFQSFEMVVNLGVVMSPCPTPIGPVVCYGPDQIRAAYGIKSVLDAGTDGTGQTIVIVDAYQSPTIQQDLDLFDHVFGIPDTTVHISAPDGKTPFDGSRLQLGWAVEISLDVEWAHAIAPGAHIELVLAKSEKDTDMLSATRFAIDHNLGDVITQSFGESEACAPDKLLQEEHAAFAKAGGLGITLVAGSGDFGAAQLNCTETAIAAGRNAMTPASDPNVIAVGGTRLVADPVSGAWGAESAWSDQFGASGGGFSAVYHRPGYQEHVLDGSKARGLPDVAYSADVYGSTIIAFGGRFGAIDGTSVGTPQWAAIAALAGQLAQHRLHNLNTRLYRIAGDGSPAFHDITTGNNTFAGVTGFSAGVGWDPVTGLGSPDVAQLLPLLGKD